MIQPCDLTPADWARAVEATFAEDAEVCQLGQALAENFDARIRLAPASTRKLAKRMGDGVSRERVAIGLRRLEVHGAIRRWSLDVLPFAIRQLCARQGPGRATALNFRWACEVLHPINA